MFIKGSRGGDTFSLAHYKIRIWKDGRLQWVDPDARIVYAGHGADRAIQQASVREVIFGEGGRDDISLGARDEGYGGADSDFFRIQASHVARVFGGEGYDVARVERAGSDLSRTQFDSVEKLEATRARLASDQLDDFQAISGVGRSKRIDLDVHSMYHNPGDSYVSVKARMATDWVGVLAVKASETPFNLTFEGSSTKHTAIYDGRGLISAELNGYVQGVAISSAGPRLIAYGTAGSDVLRGGWGNDILYGSGGPHDILYGGGGRDRLYANGASAGALLDGGSGNDYLSGGASRDRMIGGSGNDTLRGGGGNDQIFGGSGADILEGGAGSDGLYGGPGDDIFLFRRSSDAVGVGFENIAAERSRGGSPANVGFEGVGRYGGDRIDLSLIDGDTTSRGHQPLKFGGVTQKAKGFFWLQDTDGGFTELLANLDGRGGPDMRISIEDGSSIHAHHWFAGDFIL